MLHSPPRFLHALPSQPTPLLGRDAEVAAIQARLGGPGIRLLTLTGPGGAGKTRLAVEAAAGLVDRFTHGVVFVDLVPVRDAELVPAAIARALDIRQTGAGSPLAALVAGIQQQQLLLLLDNFEQVLAAAGDVVELVAACPGVTVLVTSRAPLRVRWEQELPVAPLALPSLDQAGDLAALAGAPAVALFAQRARAVRPDFTLSEDNTLDVAAICTQLQGMPLAIELAAARVRVLSPRALRARLTASAGVEALRLLSGGARDLPERQRSLRDTIAWSHDLLSPVEQTLFRRLAVFNGGCTVEAAEAVCADSPDEDEPDLPVRVILDTLTSLVEQSLVLRHDGPDGEPRFTMLETIPEFSRDQLAASGEADAMHRRHAHRLLHYAETGPRVLGGATQAEWVQRLEADHHNLRSALAWTLAVGEGELALRFCAALADFWYVRGHYREGREWSLRALGAAPHAAPAVRAAVLEGAGVLAYIQHDPEEARRLVDAGVELWRTVENPPRLAFALAFRGMLARHRGDPVTARASCEEALTISLDPPHRTGHRLALSQLGYLAEAERDPATARRLQEESLAVARGVSPMDVALQLNNAGVVTLRLGDVHAAAGHYREALQLSHEIAAAESIAASLEGLAGVATARGRPRHAAELLGAAAAVRTEVGGPPIAQYEEERRRMVPFIREALGEEGFAAATAKGGATPLAEIITRALATADDEGVGAPAAQDASPVSAAGDGTQRGRPRTASPHGLTPRQIEYLRLLAQGQTNKAIAGVLVVSETAVEQMLVRLYERIRVRNRAEAIRFAYEHGLIDPPMS